MCEAFFLNETQKLNGMVDNHMDDYDQGCRSFQTDSQPCLLELESTDKRNQSNRGRQADVLMRYTTFNAQVPTAHFALTFFEAKLKIHVSEWKSALEILSYTLWAAFLHIVFTFPEITQEKNTKTKQSVLQWVGEPHTHTVYGKWISLQLSSIFLYLSTDMQPPLGGK